MSDLIVKSNNFIEAKYRLSLIEQRLVLKLASIIKKDDEDFKPYIFNVSDLLKEFNMHEKDYKYFKDTVLSLMKRVMKIRDFQEKTELYIAFLSSAKYYENEGTVKLCFDPELKPYMLQLKQNFTSYKFEDIRRLKSIYAIRFYELLIQYKTIKKRTFEYKHLRELLGIDKKEYPRYNNFKSRVILQAQKELQAKSNLYFTFKEIKKGRKVDKLEFTIITKNRDYEIMDRKNFLNKQARQLMK